MFDIGASELLVIVIVAILVIGPSELPRALRTAGRWIGKMRRVSAHFRTGLDAMVRDAEVEDMEEQWQKQNAKIMAEYPDAEAQMVPLDSAKKQGENDAAVPMKTPPSDPALPDNDSAADSQVPPAPFDQPKAD